MESSESKTKVNRSNVVGEGRGRGEFVRVVVEAKMRERAGGGRIEFWLAVHSHSLEGLAKVTWHNLVSVSGYQEAQVKKKVQKVITWNEKRYRNRVMR